MNEFILVSTTTASREDAEKIGFKITEKKLSACSQVEGPITSVYWWKEKLEKEEEWRCTFKTAKRLFPEIEKEIKRSHPYETPEIIATEIVDGSAEYLDWLRSQIDSQ